MTKTERETIEMHIGLIEDVAVMWMDAKRYANAGLDMTCRAQPKDLRLELHYILRDAQLAGVSKIMARRSLRAAGITALGAKNMTAVHYDPR